MLSFFDGESLSWRVKMKSGGTALCFHFGAWPESRLSVFILTFLHVAWLWSKIIGLCGIYCWKLLRLSWQINAPQPEEASSGELWRKTNFISNNFGLAAGSGFSVAQTFCLTRISHVAYRKWWMQYMSNQFSAGLLVSARWMLFSSDCPILWLHVQISTKLITLPSASAVPHVYYKWANASMLN